jgi:hypothetical protein
MLDLSNIIREIKASTMGRQLNAERPDKKLNYIENHTRLFVCPIVCGLSEIKKRKTFRAGGPAEACAGRLPRANERAVAPCKKKSIPCLIPFTPLLPFTHPSPTLSVATRPQTVKPLCICAIPGSVCWHTQYIDVYTKVQSHV